MDIEYGSFIWDSKKEIINLWKHGIDFKRASEVFMDPFRKIIDDFDHSGRERRFYCIGMVGSDIVTVRFVRREDKIRIFGAGQWRKGREIYESTRFGL